MNYAYEDLSEDQFEKLIVLLCQRLLGIATQGFAKGPDGGRDAKFMGTAELHPSRTAPQPNSPMGRHRYCAGQAYQRIQSQFFGIGFL